MVTEWKVEFLEKKVKKKFFGNIKAVVIDQGICSHCSACSAICPVEGITSGDKPIDFPGWVKECLDCSACAKVCPRWEYQPLSGVGDYIELTSARSSRFVGQDGAMVTEIIASALEMGVVNSALVVGRDEEWRPVVVNVRTVDQLYDERLTGSKYSFADVLPVLKRSILKVDSLAVVGTPCMVSAVRRMQRYFKKFGRVKLLIGLFCTENFYYHQLREFLAGKGVELRNVLKVDIKGEEFKVKMVDGELSFSIKELEGIVPSGCKVCQDFTSVESDVSVGSSGSKEGFSTVIVRTEIAKRVLDYIREQGYADFDEVDLDALNRSCDYKVKIHPYQPAE